MNRDESQSSQYKSGSQSKGNYQGDFEKLKSKIRETWPNLNDNEVEHCEDNREEFLSTVQKKCGVAREEANKALRDMERQFQNAA